MVITAYSGGSVVLPCSCADPQTTVRTFTWDYQQGNIWFQVFQDEKYSGRRVLFDKLSPKNLSLLISDLRKNDQGYYRCMTEPMIYTQVKLNVKGCDLVDNMRTVEVIGYSGGSVVLPCSCTELLAKPEHIQWKYYKENQYKEIYPNEEIENYKNRVKLFDPNTPGNLSLQISALTTEDRGYYQCFVSSQQTVFVRLYVLHDEEKTSTISVSTHQLSHQTQEPSPPRQTQHTPQYVFILVAVFSVILLLAFLALSSRCGEEEVPCSDVVYVETIYTSSCTE
ncbi:polymeric immunoglobulin receptor-like [Carassius gibelio]|uniref:polymeric immunoglobulin receptor-like n=1 Tax=Carassius gibelio TaxID=101364 RepID=UPI0022778C7A|nr:polymeric immunoglobulin receptor-like [Carassius gibelio]